MGRGIAFAYLGGNHIARNLASLLHVKLISRRPKTRYPHPIDKKEKGATAHASDNAFIGELAAPPPDHPAAEPAAARGLGAGVG
jgi:hypothetical protein